MVSQTDRPGPAPLPASELNAALLPFGQSRMLPRLAYVDAGVFAWEREAFFERGWVCAGRSEEVGSPGDQAAQQTGVAGILLVRDSAGMLRAFANTCRHRGHELLPCGETANRAIVLCPYHSWSYRLDGSLLNAPGFGDDLGDVAHGLARLPVEEWHGWIFVNPSGTAPPLATCMGGLEGVIAPYEPERLVTAGRHQYEVGANWKILNENYQECYHCPLIHPELCRASPPTSGANYLDPDGAWVGGWMDLRDGWQTMSLDGRSSGTVLRNLDDERARRVAYIGVFPNLLVSLHPDYVMTHRLTPVGPERTHIECSWHFAPEDIGRAGFDPAFAVDFWDITNRQDWKACESVQRGLASAHAVPGPLSAAEDAVYQFVTMVARAYRGKPVRAEPVSLVVW